MSIRVTIEDTETGESETVLVDDYLLVTAEPCFLASRQAHRTGTHVLSVKNATPAPFTRLDQFRAPGVTQHSVGGAVST